MRMGRWVGAVGIVCGLWACNPDDGRPDVPAPDGGTSSTADAGDQTTPDAGDQTMPDAGSLQVLKLTSVDPTQGAAGDAFTLHGSGFLAGAQVFFGSAQATVSAASDDGSQLTGTVPAKADADGTTVGVRVIVADHEVRLEQAFTYVAPAKTVTWCELLAPTEAVVWEGEETPALWGKAYQPDVTPGQGQGQGLTAQVGYGSPSAAPETWAWTAAAFQKDDGNDDVFSATLKPAQAGQYAFAFRFSLDGVHYTYCDKDGDAFAAASAGTLQVKGRPAITQVSPATAKAGAQVTVGGTNLARATFAFGPNAATGVQIAADGTSATMTVPAGSGTVDVSATVDGFTVTKTGAFTYFVEPGAPVVSGVSPAFLPIAGGTLTITGSQFGASGATVQIGGQSATVTAQSDTQLTVTAPALAPGNQNVDVIAAGKTTRAATPVAYVLKFSVNVDGDLSDWPAAAKVAADTTASDWSDQNQLRALYLGYDQTNLYIGIEGRAQAQNAIVGYLSVGNQTFGTADIRTLTDGVGALDNMLSANFDVLAAGFKAHFGYGLFGSAPALDNDVQDGVGVRRLENAADFAWSRSTVHRTDNAVEIAIPWRPANAGATDAFVALPGPGEAPLKLQTFVRIVGSGGQLFPNQSLPADPNATATDAALHPQVSSVATIEVR